MEWQSILAELDNKYCFFNQINAEKNGFDPDSIHPVLKFSAGLAISAIFNESRNNRIVLHFPNRFNLDKWITLLTVLHLLKKDYNKTNSIELQFNKGDKLLFNNKCIVEFDSIEENKLWIKAADNKLATNTRFSLRLNRHLQLQPIDNEKRLSSVKRVLREYNSSPVSTLDTILDISTAGNKTIFDNNIVYVGGIGKTLEFVNNTNLNNSKIIDLFLWGKIDTDGNISILNSNNIQASPSCIIAPDLYSLMNCSSFDNNKSKAVIISNTTCCKNDPQSMHYLLDMRIPIIVITDFKDLSDVTIFKENNFEIWQWNESNLQGIAKVHHQKVNSLFSFFHHTLNNVSGQKINTVNCFHAKLESTIDEILNINKNIPEDNSELWCLHGKLFHLYNEFARLIRQPSTEWLVNLKNSILHLHELFKKQRVWISHELENNLGNVFTFLFEIIENPFPNENNKIEQLYRLFNENGNSVSTAIIVPRETDIEVTRNYWQKRINLNKSLSSQINFLSCNDFSLESLDSIPERIIVCGWLGKAKMYSILYSFITADIILLLYPHELSWYKNASSRWRKEKKYKTDYKYFLELMDINQTISDFEEINPPLEFDESLDNDDLDFEININKYRYASYNASSNSVDEIEKAKLLVLNDEYFAFFTKTHKSLVINELLQNKSHRNEIQKHTIKDLNPGDFILFFSSNKDLIREIADKILNDQGKVNLRTKATFWKKILKLVIEKASFEEVIKRLRNNGCQRHEVTIRNWYLDEDIIGPANTDDLKIILEALSPFSARKDFDTILTEMKSAITEVRGAHHQAATFISQQLIKKLPQIINKKSEFTQTLTLDLPNFGNVIILRIEEIGNEWLDIGKSNTNRLLNERLN